MRAYHAQVSVLSVRMATVHRALMDLGPIALVIKRFVPFAGVIVLLVRGPSRR